MAMAHYWTVGAMAVGAFASEFAGLWSSSGSLARGRPSRWWAGTHPETLFKAGQRLVALPLLKINNGTMPKLRRVCRTAIRQWGTWSVSVSQTQADIERKDAVDSIDVIIGGLIWCGVHRKRSVVEACEALRRIAIAAIELKTGYLTVASWSHLRWNKGKSG